MCDEMSGCEECESQNSIMQLLQGQVKKMSEKDIKKMAIQKAIDGNKAYVELCNQIIEEIDRNDPKDRLEYAVGILIIVSAMTKSLQGWANWCAIRPMDNIKLDEFENIYPKMKELSKEWIKIDKDITEAKTKDLEEELKKMDDNDDGNTDAPSKKGKKPPSQLYVA